MASMRKLSRRLLRWQRYAVTTGWTTEWAKLVRSRPPAVWSYNSEPGQRTYARRSRLLLGLIQAAAAVEAEQERRAWDETPEVWLGGPAGEAALIADVLDDDYRCCDAGNDGHPGPCVTTCSGCWGGGKCPECGGVDDLGCAECDGSGSCPDCWGQGEHIEDVYIGPIIVTVDTGGLT